VLVVLALLGLGGCRLNIDSARDGTPPDRDKLALLELGKSTLDDVLATAGAPDAIAWVDSEDVLIYESARVRSTHWTLDNPISFASRVTPQGMAGEMIAAAMFSVSSVARGLIPTRPPSNRPMPESTPEIMGSFGKPLRLNGDRRGDDQIRFIFEPVSHHLVGIETIYASPTSGAGAIAENTFLR
jgi:hypothetical protein